MNQMAYTNDIAPHKASFRDPSGFVFTHQEKIHRHINEIYQPHYEHLMNSGLYQKLTNNNWLIHHAEIESPSKLNDAYKIIIPSQIPFVSYPYEWSFSQLKDAALLTLSIQEAALTHGMTMKDASAYNIQFYSGRPIFIDTLSFEMYEEGKPWQAYKQFCQHFLAPLTLMAKVDVRLNALLKNYIDGIPLDLASSLLAKRSWLSPGLLIHLHVHAKMQRKFSQTKNVRSDGQYKTTQLSKQGLLGILHSLRNTIKKLDWKPEGTEWVDYYQETNYSNSAFIEKQRIIKTYLQHINPKTVWDLGANTGHFSRLAKERGAMTIAFDIDPAAVEINYRILKEQKQNGPLPLLLDLTNPSPGIGWSNEERDSLQSRAPSDCIMALAIIHHLTLSNNVPLDRVASFFAKLGHHLIIEFVPKSDSQVERLLRSRKDIFVDYNQAYFEKIFGRYFDLDFKDTIQSSSRVLYLMTRKEQHCEQSTC